HPRMDRPGIRHLYPSFLFGVYLGRQDMQLIHFLATKFDLFHLLDSCATINIVYNAFPVVCVNVRKHDKRSIRQLAKRLLTPFGFQDRRQIAEIVLVFKCFLTYSKFDGDFCEPVVAGSAFSVSVAAFGIKRLLTFFTVWDRSLYSSVRFTNSMISLIPTFSATYFSSRSAKIATTLTISSDAKSKAATT